MTQDKFYRKVACVILGAVFIVSLLLSPGCLKLSGITSPISNSDSGHSTNRTTVFEAYTGNYISRTEYPYEMLLVRADGLVYYETGSRSHLRQSSKIRMRQGQITAEQVTKLKNLIETCPSEIESKSGSNQTFFSGPYAFLFSPTRTVWEYEERDKRIATNFNPFTQNLTAFPDVPDEAKALWEELFKVVDSTVPTSVHPDLWPDKYFDERNYAPVPPLTAKV